jgi:hypothetical protein
VARVVKNQKKKKRNRKPVTLMYKINWNSVSCVVHTTLISQKSLHVLPKDEGTQILNGISAEKLCTVINYTKHTADGMKRNDKEKVKGSTRININ